MRAFLVSISVVLFLNACTKDSPDTSLNGDWRWVKDVPNNPAYTSTPQSTGINRTLTFGSDRTYKVVENGAVTQSGTVITRSFRSQFGEAMELRFTNSRVTDSLAYCQLQGENNELFFSHSLSGSVGATSGYYQRN